MKKQEALERLDEMEKLISSFGVPDCDALHKLSTHAFAFRHSGRADAYLLEKLSSFERWAERGLSTKKFERYSGGLTQVKTRALSDCVNIRSLVEADWPES